MSAVSLPVRSQEPLAITPEPPAAMIFSIELPSVDMLDQLKENGCAVIGVGKIHDIFCVGKGLTEYVYTQGNEDGINKTLDYMDKEFRGALFY